MLGPRHKTKAKTQRTPTSSARPDAPLGTVAPGAQPASTVDQRGGSCSARGSGHRGCPGQRHDARPPSVSRPHVESTHHAGAQANAGTQPAPVAQATVGTHAASVPQATVMAHGHRQCRSRPSVPRPPAAPVVPASTPGADPHRRTRDHEGAPGPTRLSLARRAEGADSPPIKRGVVGREDEGKAGHPRVQSLPTAWPNNRVQATGKSLRSCVAPAIASA